jgi:hypothetical protein
MSLWRRYSREFGDDVVRIARNHGPDVNLVQIAKDFSIPPRRYDTYLL